MYLTNKRKTLVAAATTAAASLLLATSQPSGAAGRPVDDLTGEEQIAASATAVAMAAGPAFVKAHPSADGSLHAKVGPSSISLPGDGGGSVQVDGIGIGIPGEGDLKAVPAEDGTVIYSAPGGKVDAAVQVVADGVRMLTVAKDATAPSEYRYPLSLPAGSTLAATEDGSILVRDAKRDLIANIDAAWAKDSTGAPVPTAYRIEGTTIVQTIRTTPNTVFPVVADPVWIPVFLLIARIILAQGIKSFSRHALSRMAQRGISRQMVENAVKHGRRSSGGSADTVKFTHGKIWVVVNKAGNVVSVGWK